MNEIPIAWKAASYGSAKWREIRLMNPDHSIGVIISLMFQETCYRRGQWKMLVEISLGKYHHAWGCFDEQDQPVRYYHDEAAALGEGVRIARVLLKGFVHEKQDSGGEASPVDSQAASKMAAVRS